MTIYVAESDVVFPSPYWVQRHVMPANPLLTNLCLWLFWLLQLAQILPTEENFLLLFRRHNPLESSVEFMRVSISIDRKSPHLWRHLLTLAYFSTRKQKWLCSLPQCPCTLKKPEGICLQIRPHHAVYHTIARRLQHLPLDYGNYSSRMWRILGLASSSLPAWKRLHSCVGCLLLFKITTDATVVSVSIYTVTAYSGCFQRWYKSAVSLHARDHDFRRGGNSIKIAADTLKQTNLR